MSDWAVVILAAGKGVRMNSKLPKPLHKVCGKEMVRQVMEVAAEVVVGPMVVVTPPGNAAIRKSLGKEAQYVEQSLATGTARALQETETILLGKASHVLVLNADIPLILKGTLQRLIKQHEETNAEISFLTSDKVSPDRLGRVMRDLDGQVLEVIEAADASPEQCSIAEVNGGVYAFNAAWLWPALRELMPSSSGEFYLTGLIQIASAKGLLVGTIQPDEPVELLGVDDRVHLAQAESAMRERILNRWMLAGVTVVDPTTTYIDATVTLGQDTIIYPNTTIRGESNIGFGCQIGPGAQVYDSVIDEQCRIGSSVLEGVQLGCHVEVGPFSHLRPGTKVENEARIGNYAEIKNSRIGQNTNVGHFSYVGDADIGNMVNIGAGTITCNYDGVRKHQTIVEDGAFIGSSTMLVAPVRVGAGARTGAGSVVTKNVSVNTTVFGVPARVDDRVEKESTLEES